MKPAKIAVICIAAVSAIGLALVVRQMGSSSEPAAEAPAVAATRVLVAARDLGSGARLTDADLDWKDWPADQVNPAYFTDGTRPAADAAAAEATQEDGEKTVVERGGEAVRAVAALGGPGAKADFIGAVVREPLLAGEPLTARKIVRAGDSGYLAVVLEPGMRGLSIPVSVSTTAGGFILPGDRVDVLLSREVRNNNESSRGPVNNYVVATVMQNVRVMAIDQTTEIADDAQSVIGATATLELSPADAEIVTLAQAEGDLSLSLRSYADTAGPSGRGFVRQVSQSPEPVAVRVFRGGSEADVVVIP